MAKFFHVNGLPIVLHTDETRAILEDLNGESKSKFQREKIVSYAQSLGFKWEWIDSVPDFLTTEQWSKIYEFDQKSNKVDYTYLVAYYWLKSLDKFQYVSDASLQRLIITS